MTRTVSDELWARVKERQQTTKENFARTTTNRLNNTHRPSYLLSGILECAECGGSYAVMAKDRYGCSNHKNKLPIDGLGGNCCSNQKTILRKDLEDRVLSCLPAAFFEMGLFEDVYKQVHKIFSTTANAAPDDQEPSLRKYGLQNNNHAKLSNKSVTALRKGAFAYQD
jgi:hypothetical protein